jgi:DNA-binding response OmpR family regulator
MERCILICEDEAGLRQAVRIYLEHAGFQVLEAADGQEALELLHTEKIDCLVTDIMMPRMDGRQLVMNLRAFSQIPVLYLSAKSEEYDIIDGFDLGADDYMTKPFSGGELVARVKNLLRRCTRHADLTLRGLSLDPAAKEVQVNGNTVHLTPKEFDILELLLRHPGQVFTNDQIYEAVWKEEAVTTETVAVHVRRLREKIEENPRKPQYIQVVWGVGYKMRK